MLEMSNDFKEGRHVVDAIQRLIDDADPVKIRVLDELRRFISYVSGIGFCLSSQGDMLSQWRGYADAAQGVAAFNRRKSTPHGSFRGVFLSGSKWRTLGYSAVSSQLPQPTQGDRTDVLTAKCWQLFFYRFPFSTSKMKVYSRAVSSYFLYRPLTPP